MFEENYENDTMDNPRALASRLAYVQMDKHGLTSLYHLH